ncbi:integrase [Pseudomonas sp. DCA-1]|uniref:integrase n=1 Tax=Pseudomonas sp. DCA-1 TaxID=3344874 RepID=UPI003977D3BB
MSGYAQRELTWSTHTAQPSEVRGLPESERDALIIKATHVDGQWVIISRYGDDIWELDGLNSNVQTNRKQLAFHTLPRAFRAVMKAILYRYLHSGRRGGGRPKGGGVLKCYTAALPFLRHLEALNLDHLGAVTPMVCATYVAACKAHVQTGRNQGKPLAQGALQFRFSAVEALYELSQYTDDPIPEHPWPETSSTAMAGLTAQSANYYLQSRKTPLIPDDVFCILFERAYHQVECGNYLLDIRDELNAFSAQCKYQCRKAIRLAKNRKLESLGWKDGLREFLKAVNNLRISSYIVLASTSGCRNHELAYVQKGAYHQTQDDEGTSYHWMRSRSQKTDVGIHDWMIPEAGVQALHLMERWAAPYQTMIDEEIVERRRTNPHDPEIVEAYKHRQALFIGIVSKKDKEVRTVSNTNWNKELKAFAKNCGLSWDLTSHQFRRKFANYVAHSRFGDLRYLKEHYAHWSIDMTLLYAMDENWGQHLDLELFDETQAELKDGGCRS